MLTTRLAYYKPGSIQEAVKLHQELHQAGNNPMYYAGGTEILTLQRLSLVEPGAIIDIKGIPECVELRNNGNILVIGSAVPLTFLEDKNPFSLLTLVSKGIADRTARNKITLGGNICGEIFYREAVLPFLLSDSKMVIAKEQGNLETVPIHEIFRERLQLEVGQFLVQIQTDVAYLGLPFIARKIRQQWNTGYPLITGAALKKDGFIRFAFSGLCAYPFQSVEMEKALNNRSLSLQERIRQAIEHIPGPVLDDVEGTSEYRVFVLKNLLEDFLAEMGGA